MYITNNVWEKIRHKFTEDEKKTLRAAIDGEVICPRAISVDLSKLSQELIKKIDEAKLAL